MGEEVFESNMVTLMHKKQQIITLDDNPLVTFRVPESLETGVVQLISKMGNSDNLLGSMSLNLKVLCEHEIMQIDEELTVENDENESKITGSLQMASIPMVK